MLHPFEQLLYARCAQNIAAWDTQRHPDIYAIALFYDSFYSADAAGQEVAIQGRIRLSYNTLAHYQAQIAQASSAQEAKWNSSFWLQKFIAIVPREFAYGEDPPTEELALRDAWCASLGIAPNGQEGGGRPTYAEPTLYAAIRNACTRVAQSLHQSGLIQEKIGKPIPIVIHERDRTQAGAESTRAANPPGLSQEAEEWELGHSYAQIAAYEVMQQQIRARPLAEQAQYWRDALVSFWFDQPSESVTQLQSLGRNQYDVRKELVAIGAGIVAEMLSLVEEYALQEQYRLRESPDKTPGRGWTPASWITTTVLDVIREVGSASDSEVDRLYTLLSQLYRASQGQEWTGSNLSAVASTLHRLQPQRFPPPSTGHRDNKLLNHAEYGLEANKTS